MFTVKSRLPLAYLAVTGNSSRFYKRHSGANVRPTLDRIWSIPSKVAAYGKVTEALKSMPERYFPLRSTPMVYDGWTKTR